MRILIIEDDSGTAELMRECLEIADFEIDIVNSFEFADDFLNRITPDLMIVDYYMGAGLNAQEWLTKRKQNNLKQPVFIVSTGQGDERIAVNMMKLGARDYFVKDTLLFERLTEVVKRIRIELDTEKKLEQVKNDLDDKEARYKLLVENSGIGVGLYSLDGKILFFNQKAVQDLGGVKEDYIGRNLVEVFGPVLGSKYQKRIEEVVENDTTLEFTDFIPDLGRECWLLTNHTPVKNNDGQIIGVQVLAHDITDRISAENEIKKISDFYRSIIENASDGVTIIDENARHKYVSPTGLKMFGYATLDLVQSEPNKLTHPDDLPNVLFHLNKLIEEPTYSPTIEYRFLHKNGSWIWIESTFSNLLSNDNIKGIVINFRDIDKKKKAEIALGESKKMLNKLLLINSELIASELREIDYDKFTDILIEISGAKYASFNLFADNGLDFSTKSIRGIADISLKAFNILGFDPMNKVWPHDSYRADKIKANIITIFNSWSELTQKAVPPKISRIVELSFNLGPVAIAKVSTTKSLIGDFTLLFEKGQTLQNAEIIELFVNQYAQYLERIKAEEKLRVKMDELIKFKNVTVGRELAMIELKKEVNELLQKLGEAQKYMIVGE